MFTVEVAAALGLSVRTVVHYEKLLALGVERRCGRLWWSEDKITLLQQELARRAEARRCESLYPRTPEVASRLGVGENELRALIHEHGLRVDKDKTGRYYQWTEEAIAAATALLEDLAKRPPKSPAPPPPGMTSKQAAARLKMKSASFTHFSLAVRKRHPSLQPVRHKGTLYWRQEDVALLQQALEEQRERPDWRHKRLMEAQKGRLAHLQRHARAIRNGVNGMTTPEAASARQHVDSILALCEEIEAALTFPLTFINTLPAEGWSLRLPVSVWVRAIIGGFEAEAVEFDLRAHNTTRQGAITSLRHALLHRYQELARDPAQDEAAWRALRQIVVPPPEAARRG